VPGSLAILGLWEKAPGTGWRARRQLSYTPVELARPSLGGASFALGVDANSWESTERAVEEVLEVHKRQRSNSKEDSASDDDEGEDDNEDGTDDMAAAAIIASLTGVKNQAARSCTSRGWMRRRSVAGPRDRGSGNGYYGIQPIPWDDNRRCAPRCSC